MHPTLKKTSKENLDNILYPLLDSWDPYIPTCSVYLVCIYKFTKILLLRKENSKENRDDQKRLLCTYNLLVCAFLHCLCIKCGPNFPLKLMRKPFVTTEAECDQKRSALEEDHLF